MADIVVELVVVSAPVVAARVVRPISVRVVVVRVTSVGREAVGSSSAACDSLDASHRLRSNVIHSLCLRVENALRVCEELLLGHRGGVWVQDCVTCKCYA